MAPGDPDINALMTELEYRVLALETARGVEQERWHRLEKKLETLQSSVDQMIGAATATREIGASNRAERTATMTAHQWVVTLIVTVAVAAAGFLIGRG